MILVYVPSTWVETGLSTVQKVSFLNNLETIYSSVVDYIDNITHASSYYTDAECAALFFGPDNQGAGSGLVAMTLDGMSAQAIIDAGTPQGCIAIWSSTEGSIPGGFYLCDGNNGTPNLQDKFIVGSGGNYSYGNTGGSDTVTTAASITVGGHELTAAETPLHNHGEITDHFPKEHNEYGDYGPAGYDWVTSVQNNANYTANAGSGDSHTHSASFAGSTSQDKRPPFYALCYIQKS